MAFSFLEPYCSDNHLTIGLSDAIPTGQLVEAPEGSLVKYLLKVPVAPLGEWEHPVYGKVRFSQQDFDDISANWQTRKTGYEPPLFLGHDLNTQVMEAQPSYAFLVDVKQEDNVLFGYYEPIEDGIFETLPNGGIKVRDKGVYRYSSAEVVVNAKSKFDGSDIGTLLVGTALTNRPFIPNLPKPELVTHYAFSDQSSTLSLVYGDPSAMTTQSSTTTAESAPQATAVAPAAPAATTQIPNAQALLSDDLISRMTRLADVVTQQASDIQTLTASLQAANSRIQELESTSLQTTIAAMNVPAGVRDAFSDLILGDSLPIENRRNLLTKLQQLSDQNAAIVTGVNGDTSQTVESTGAGAEGTTASTETVNPYSGIIQQNLALADKLAARNV